MTVGKEKQKISKNLLQSDELWDGCIQRLCSKDTFQQLNGRLLTASFSVHMLDALQQMTAEHYSQALGHKEAFSPEISSFGAHSGYSAANNTRARYSLAK